jgi:hypothetical protein
MSFSERQVNQSIYDSPYSQKMRALAQSWKEEVRHQEANEQFQFYFAATEQPRAPKGPITINGQTQISFK